MPTVEQRLTALENMLKNNTMGSMLKWRPANLNVAQWSDVSPDIGHITAGDMELGQSTGRRIVFSDIDHGMLDYDEHNRIYKRETYITDYFRLGLPEHAGIDYNGVTEEVEIDGRCNLPLTIPVGSLNVENDIAIFLNTGVLPFVSLGTLGLNNDGSFTTWGAEAFFEYVTLRDGNIEIANLYGNTGLTLKAFSSESSETGIIGLISSTKMNAVSAGVQFSTPDGSFAQTLYLSSEDGLVFAELGPGTLEIKSHDREFTYSVDVSESGITTVKNTKTGGGSESAGLILSVGMGGMYLDGVRNILWGYPVNFYNSIYPTERATVPLPSDMRWDYTNSVYEYYSGTEYKTLATTVAPYYGAKGFFIGGVHILPAPPFTIQMYIADRVVFSTDVTAACATADLVQQREAPACVAQAEVKAFISGGMDTGPVYFASTEKLTFVTEITEACATAALSEARYWLAGLGDGDLKGYLVGGGTPTEVVIADKIIFPIDTIAAVATANLSQARGGLAGISNGSTQGYFVGGEPLAGGYVTTADKVAFATDTTAACPAANLSQARGFMAGVSDGSTQGYFAGGDVGAYDTPVATADKLVFSTDTTSACATANLSQARWGLAGLSGGAAKGYFGGGCTPTESTPVVTMDKITFATDATAACVTADLSADRYGVAGASDTGW
jgi:hypothetical protein